MLTKLRFACFVCCISCVGSLYFLDGGNATWWVRLVGTVFVIVYGIAALSLDSEIKTLRKDGQNDTHPQLHRLTKAREIMREVFLVVFVFFIIFTGIAALASWQNAKCVFDPAMDFRAARVEWFLAVSAGLAVIGAVWAVWAKVMADKAFQAAQSADDKAYKAFLSATTKAIPFDQLIGNQILHRHIDSANTKMRLLLGLPEVGFFYKNSKNELALVDDACRLATQISAKTNSILAQGGKVDILFFDRELCASIAGKAAVDPRIKTKFLSHYDSFVASLQCDSVNEQLKWYGYALAAQRPTASEFDPGIRIAIVDMGKPGINSEKAIIWFVSEFLDETPTDFRAAALETFDPSLINLMNSLMDYYQEKFKTISPANPCQNLGTVIPPEPKPPEIKPPTVPIADAAVQVVSAPKTETPSVVSEKPIDDIPKHPGAANP